MKHTFSTLCIPVRGFLRTAVYDLQMGNYFFTTITSPKGVSKFNTHPSERKDLISANIIIEKNNEFLQLEDMTFDYPSLVTNAIIEVDLNFSFESTFFFLQKIRCFSLQIVMVNECLQDEMSFNKFIQDLSNTNIRYCELVISYTEYSKLSHKLDKKQFAELNILYVYNSPENFIQEATQEYPVIIFFQDTYSYQNAQNKKSISFFSVNINLFTESLNFNNYYNRKLFIDRKGTVKHHPYSEDSLFMINDKESISKMSEDSLKTELWFVKKDSIEVCNLCEYRYMCVDSRIPVKSKKRSMWYHTTECNYNPFIAKWENEEGYRSLSECGISISDDGVKIEESLLQKSINEVYLVQ